MARPGIFGGFYFDPEVFSDYMMEQPYIANAIIASGIVVGDPTMMEMIGTKGNVGTMPFYIPIDADLPENIALNNNGLTDNTPIPLAGNKQTFMLIQRMKAWTDKDFTRELTGANPLQNMALQVASYYSQTWQRILMAQTHAVSELASMADHKTDISVSSGTIDDTNKIAVPSLVELAQKALGDMAGRFSLCVMHSKVYTRLKLLQLIDFNKYTIPNAVQGPVTLPTYDGKIVVVDDRGTVDTTTPGFPKYKTRIIGTGSFLSANKALINPFYVAYDPERNAGENSMYTKQSRTLHPNGFTFRADNVATESPTDAELSNPANFELRFNPKNIAIATLISNG